jgi:hypothetical protein
MHLIKVTNNSKGIFNLSSTLNDYCNFFNFFHAPPNSLKDSNVSSKVKITNE